MNTATAFAILTDACAIDQICYSEAEAKREALSLNQMGFDVQIWTGSAEQVDNAETIIHTYHSATSALREAGCRRAHTYRVHTYLPR